ncbi:MerR family transcriptional regulator [Gorillibacterium sp. CAU 1737]|uniref:MerR family transcriptional regulator n=1 Tax=Gorillibacterium sp. CAU 1737 TaxID=3140362 RepID=UPI003260F1ED
MTAPLLKIREVTLQYGITTRALQYYEEMGLIKSLHVDDYSYRCYDEEAVKRLEHILILRKLDISIKDIARIFSSPNASVLIEVLSDKLKTIDREKELLLHLRSLLIALIEQIESYDMQKEMDLKLLYEKANKVESYIEGFQDAEKAKAAPSLLETVEQLEKKPDIRILTLPPVRMARSGKKGLEPFDRWFSAIHPPQNLFPRDFMWFNPVLNDFEWLFAIPEGMTDTNGFEVFDFPGGLYAAAVAFDDDDINRVNTFVHKWAEASEVYAVSTLENDEAERYDMGHIIGSMEDAEGNRREQMDLFIPIVKRSPLPQEEMVSSLK